MKRIIRLVQLCFLFVLVIGGGYLGYQYFFGNGVEDRPIFDVPSDVREQKERTIAEMNEKLKATDLTDSRKFEIYNQLGMTYQSLGYMKKSVEYFQKAAALFPTDYVAYDNLGGVYASLQRYQDAEKYYKQALANSPYQYYIYRHLADLYENARKPDDMIRAVYQDAITKMQVVVGGNGLKQAHVDYAMYLEKTESYDEAISQWQRVLLDFYKGNNPDVQKKIEELHDKKLTKQ